MRQIWSILTSVLLCVVPQAMSIELPPNIQQYLQNGDVTEGEGRLTGTQADQAAFVDYVKLHWSEMLDNIESIAPGARPQYVIIAAAEQLPGRQYLSFMNKLCERKAAGKVTAKAFEHAILGLTPKKRGFLAWNHQDQQVRQLVQRIQGMLPQTSGLQPWLTDILSGAAVGAAEAATLGQSNPAPETLAPQ